MNKLLDKFANAEIDRQVAELRKRGTGRSTSLALGLIASALAEPGQAYQQYDHYQGAKHFADLVRAKLQDLALEHYTLEPLERGEGARLTFTFLEAGNG